MNKQHVAFIELTVFAGVYPLASGYMRAAASLNQKLDQHYTFEINSICINDSNFEQQLDQIDAEIYAISCYVWNMGFIKRWLPKLIAKNAHADIILGGPQVMNQGKRYLSPQHPKLVLCNGEGEHTFSNYLLELLSDNTNLKNVKGLSFYSSDELITTPAENRIQDLNIIPSPYLEGYLPPAKYVWAPIETNRGCPYKCTYCFWGAATNARVFKTELERVKTEISWLSDNRVMYIFIADANFGMLKRDIEIAEHLAECKQKAGYPLTVFFSSAKNSPARVTEITKILSNAGLISTQPVSLQTMDSNALESVKRSNIKETAYIKLQEDLHENNLSSFIEMIWPLPGETLSSFKAGLGKLCSSGADAFVIHHLLLINNVEMSEQIEEYQLEVTDDADENSEAQVVIATRDVNREEYKEGVRFGYHITSLYSLRALRFTGKYLDHSGILSFEDLISAFSTYCSTLPNDPYMTYINKVIDMSGQTQFSANGGIFHVTLHQHRLEFDRLLYNFINTLDINDEQLQLMLELDLLNRPHVYYNTPVMVDKKMFKHITVLEQQQSGLTVKIPEQQQKLIKEYLNIYFEGNTLKINYHTTQMPFMENKAYEDNLSYCEAKLHKMGSILPIWSEVEEQHRPIKSDYLNEAIAFGQA